jgi:hypothetical protein
MRCFIPVLSNYALEYAINRIQGNHGRPKLNGTHQHLVYDDDDINILGESVHTKKKNTEVY